MARLSAPSWPSLDGAAALQHAGVGLAVVGALRAPLPPSRRLVSTGAVFGSPESSDRPASPVLRLAAADGAELQSQQGVRRSAPNARRSCGAEAFTGATHERWDWTEVPSAWCCCMPAPARRPSVAEEAPMLSHDAGGDIELPSRAESADELSSRGAPPTSPTADIQPVSEQPTNGSSARKAADGAHSSTRKKKPKGYLEIERDDRPILALEDGSGVSAASVPERPAGGSPLWVIAANNVVYMAAPLSLPATMAASGWVWGTLILGYSIVSTYHSGLLLGDIIVQRPHLDSYPKVAAEACAVWATRYLDTRLISVDLVRRIGSELIVVLQFCAYFFDSAAQILFCAEYFDQLMPQSPVCQGQWLLITWLLTIPLMQAPNFGESSASVLVAGLCLLLNVATFLGEVLTYQPWNCEPGPQYIAPNAPRVFVGFTAFAYAFGGHGMYPEEVREMKDPRDWPKVMKFTYGTCSTMYIVCGYLGYFAYGSAARANLNSNFPNNALNTASIVVQLVVTYYCIYVTSLVMLLHVEQHVFGIDPRVSCGQTTPRTAATRFVFRTAFVGLQVLLCWCLIGVSGDVLLSMTSLSGAIGMTALTYILPFVLHWVLHPEKVQTRRMRAWYVINIVLGLVIMIGGTVSGVNDLLAGFIKVASGEDAAADDAADGDMCHLEFMYAPQSPCDACHVSGLPEEYYTLPKDARLPELCETLFDDDLRRTLRLRR